MKRSKNNKGFTLIELIVVVAIIAILAAIAVPAYGNIQDRAARSAAVSNARILISNINGHNALAVGDVNLWPISAAAAAVGTDGVALSGTAENAAAQADAALATVANFNGACAIDISGMTDADYTLALRYLTVEASGDVGLDETYDHTTP